MFLHLLLVATLLSASEQPQQGSDGASLTLAASTKKKILEVRRGSDVVRRYDIAVGSKKHPTPHGRFTVRHLIWNPDWKPPKEKWARDKKATPPGHPDNPMRVVKIFFREPDYYIHGTDDEESIGHARSHGCIRMTERDAMELGRYLMENAGAHRPSEWYDRVFKRGRPASVWLPRGVKMVIGK